MLKTGIRLVVLTAALSVAGCGSSPTPSPVDQSLISPATKAPVPGAPSGANAPGLYADNCAACHGVKREGGLGPPLEAQRLSGIADATLRDLISNGRPNTAMPPFNKLGAGQIDALIQLLKNTTP